VAEHLVAWLHGTPISVLTSAPEFRIRMEWLTEGIERWGLGSQVTWGIRRRTAASVVAETLDRVLAAVHDTPGDERVLSAIGKQAERVRRN
jgi:hypothetical protein